jgi:histidine triad (HIT) family protein
MIPHYKEMTADCLFCRIVAGTHDAAIVFRDDHSLAFLDHRPLFPGHCLLMPRNHVETLAELPAEEISPLFGTAQRISHAMEEALGAEGSFVAINNRVSQSVPHLHIHVVPRKRKDGLRGFFWPRGKYASAEEMEEIRLKVERAVAGVYPHRGLPAL